MKAMQNHDTLLSVSKPRCYWLTLQDEKGLNVSETGRDVGDLPKLSGLDCWPAAI